MVPPQGADLQDPVGHRCSPHTCLHRGRVYTGACLNRGVSTAIKYHHILNIKHDEVKRQVGVVAGVVVGAANGFLLDPNLWMAGGGLE